LLSVDDPVHDVLVDVDEVCLNMRGKHNYSFYPTLWKNFMQTWNKYVPLQKDMQSNCWYSSNIHSLPSSLNLKVKNVYSYKNLSMQFPEIELKAILNSVSELNISTVSIFPTKKHLCLPLVYLIGFPKCGTSLLYTYIASHPLFAKPRYKEGQFWRDVIKIKSLRYRELNLLIYLYHFLEASKEISKNNRKFTIDASASTVYAVSSNYDSYEEGVCTVPYLLQHALPNTKILVILRNPVDRLWSDYWYFCSRFSWRVNGEYRIPNHIPNIAPILFHNLTLKAIKEFNDCITKSHTEIYCAVAESPIPDHSIACDHLRLGLSIYYFHLIKWFNVFPRKQIKIVRLEDLSISRVATMNTVWNFLGINQMFTLPKFLKNTNSWIKSPVYKNSFVLLPETKLLLENFFKPFNRKLSVLLDDERYLWRS